MPAKGLLRMRRKDATALLAVSLLLLAERGFAQVPVPAGTLPVAPSDGLFLPPGNAFQIPADLRLKEEPLAIKDDMADKPKDGKDGGEGKGDKDCEKDKKPECKTFWETVPPIHIFPRLGNFPMLPSGPGYYSLLDWWRGDYRQSRPKFPYPPFALMAFPFFDADFRYLDSPKNQEFDWSDCLHRIHCGCWLFNTGGEVRYMYQDLPNFNLTGNNIYKHLLRERVYLDSWYLDRFRLYMEMLDARDLGPFNPGPLDEDTADFLNLFVDVKMFDICDKGVYARVGRQELLFGSERLISPLDFANTKRTFQGVRGYRIGEKFDTDVFWVQPVIPDPVRMDWVDTRVNFAGWWNTYRPQKGQFLDAYYLFLSNQNNINRLGVQLAPTDVHTFGTRYCGDKNNWLWDGELMMQFGNQQARGVFAGAATCGGGYHFKCCPWQPTFWGYFDYASGTNNPDGGSFNTFNELFPFGHYYLGWADLVGRRNIFDANCHFFLYPTNWTQIWLAYHHFWLASPRDALYSANGLPSRRDPTGAAGSDVGSEVDCIINFTLSKHQNVMIDYNHFFGGRFVQQTGGRADAGTLYFIYDFRW